MALAVGLLVPLRPIAAQPQWGKSGKSSRDSDGKCASSTDSAYRQLLEIISSPCSPDSANLKKMAVLLAANPALVNKRNSSNCTPLHLAVKSGNRAAVELLLDRGAEVNAIGCGTPGAYNTIGPAPIEYGFMYSEGAPLYWAVNQGNLDIVRLLLSRHADPNIQNSGSYFCCQKQRVTALDCAARSGRADIVKVLLEHKANVNLSGPLAYARNADVANLLIAAGASMSPADYLNSPLASAAGNGYVDVVKVLLEHGANVNQRQSDFHSALFVAASLNQPEVVRILLAHGAKVEKESTASNEIPRSPLDEAERLGYKNIAEIIRKSQRLW